MTEWESKRNGLLSKKVIEGLESRNMEGYFVNTKEEALTKMLELIPEGSSIGWGGTMSVAAIGGFDAIHNGKYKLFDRDMAQTKEEKDKVQREVFFADFFLTSANAITEDGILVNIDGNANRVSAIAFGPAHVIVVAGMNKIVKSEEDALSRAKNIAAPINAQRFGLTTPCAKTGACYDCKSHDTICCQTLITRYSKHDGRIKVILVNEDLGF
ncbi:MAG: lactate utilization protein [Lachnospiraceae bacterium]|nr:lactate utilization protein [Lachnospiraceae bacterium]